MKIGHYLLSGSLMPVFFLLTGFSCDRKTPSPGTNANDTLVTVYPGYKLVWQDEFNGTELRSADWNYETGGSGWGNNELEYYTSGNRNAYLQNGNLVIEAKKEDMGNRNYTSARITTAGKHEFQYGRIDIRAKLPVQSGMWPALWMLGNDIGSKGWPYCGEIDIMEYYRGKVLANITVGGNRPYNALWYSNTKAVKLFDANWKNEFHIWRMDWDENAISLYVDDQLLNKVELSRLVNKDGSGINPFKQPHYMLLNLAMGGTNGGTLENTKFPNRFEVDYVRVYQKE